jgi:hypothetical protein
MVLIGLNHHTEEEVCLDNEISLYK